LVSLCLTKGGDVLFGQTASQMGKVLMRQIKRGSMVVVLLVLFASARDSLAQDNELRSIATRIQTLKKVVNDKYVSEQE